MELVNKVVSESFRSLYKKKIIIIIYVGMGLNLFGKSHKLITPLLGTFLIVTNLNRALGKILFFLSQEYDL